MILFWKKTLKRIDKGELIHGYWADRWGWKNKGALVLMFTTKPTVMHTRNKKHIRDFSKRV